MSQNDYEQGQIDARLDFIDERHKENLARFDAIEATLKDLVESVSVAKGGLRLLFAVGTISAGLGTVAHSIIKWISEHVK
jgi:hypothetical protein